MAAKRKYVRSFVVDRSKWLNGHVVDQTGDDSMLVSDQEATKGMMCCLGFYGQQCGKLTKKAMLGHVSYDWMNLRRVPSALLSFIEEGTDTLLADDIMRVNDSRLTPKERETRLKTLFASAGVRLTFTGKYPTIKDGQVVR